MVHGGVPMTGGTRKLGYTISVTGLGPHIRKTDLQETFGDFGQIARIDLNAGKAFLEFDDKRDAEDAIKTMNGKSMQSSTLRVEMKKAEGPGVRITGGAVASKPSSDGPFRHSEDGAIPPYKKKPAVEGQRRHHDDSDIATTQTKKAGERSSIPEWSKKDQGRKRRRSPSCSRSRSRDRSRRNISRRHDDEKLHASRDRGVVDGKAMLDSQKPKDKKQKTKKKELEEEMLESNIAQSAKKKKRKQKGSQNEELQVSAKAAVEAESQNVVASIQGLETDSNEPTGILAATMKPVTVNWSQKVQEWMAKKAQDDPTIDEADNGSTIEPEQEHMSASVPPSATDEPPKGNSDTKPSMPKCESAAGQQFELKVAEMAEKLAPVTRKCEHAAVEQMLDRAMAAKLVAAACADTKRATSSQQSASAHATANEKVQEPKVNNKPENGATNGRDTSTAPVAVASEQDSRGRSGKDSSPARRENPLNANRAPQESSHRSESNSIPTGRHNRNRSPSPRRTAETAIAGRIRLSSRSPPRRRSGSPRRRERLMSGGWDRRQTNPSAQQTQPLPKAAKEAPTPVALLLQQQQALPVLQQQQAMPMLQQQQALPMLQQQQAIPNPTLASAAPTAAPNFLMGVPPGWGVQTDGSVFGHGGIVNTATGEWLCPRCRWRNFNTRRQCVQCKIQRPF